MHETSYREALARAMDDGLAAHDNAIIMGQGVDDHKGTFGTTLNLHKKFGASRVFDTPLAEEGMTGIAIGASLNGLYPIQTHIRADFSIVAMNQIVNLGAKYNYVSGGRCKVPMLIRLVIGRSWGQGAQHSQSFQSLFAHIPGLTVIMPAHPQSIAECYAAVIGKYPGPVISLEHRLMYDLRYKPREKIKRTLAPPRTSYLMRSGKDITIVATSIMVIEATRAAEWLQTQGIDCEVIDLNCVTHPDYQMIKNSVKKTGRLIVADTSWKPFGVCAEICRVICESDPGALKAPAVTMGMAHAPCPTAKALEDLFYPNLTTLTDAICKLATGKQKHGIKLPLEKSMADVYKKFRGPF